MVGYPSLFSTLIGFIEVTCIFYTDYVWAPSQRDEKLDFIFIMPSISSSLLDSCLCCFCTSHLCSPWQPNPTVICPFCSSPSGDFSTTPIDHTFMLISHCKYTDKSSLFQVAELEKQLRTNNHTLQAYFLRSGILLLVPPPHFITTSTLCLIWVMIQNWRIANVSYQTGRWIWRSFSGPLHDITVARSR